MKEDLIKLSREKGFLSSRLLLIQLEEIFEIEQAYYLWLCLLQKWLREEHKIDVQTIRTYNRKGNGYHLGIVFINDKKEVDTIILKSEIDLGIQYRTIFKTYEQALEFGLQEALKLIKTV